VVPDHQETACAGVLAEIDRAALVAYCQAWADYIEACEKLVIESASSFRTRRHVPEPWVGIKKQRAGSDIEDLGRIRYDAFEPLAREGRNAHGSGPDGRVVVRTGKGQ